MNIHQTESEQTTLGSLDEQLRLREEIERQIEAERVVLQRTHQEQQEQELRARQLAATVALQEEEARLRHSTYRSATYGRKHRPYTIDALLLCVVTLGLGTLIGPAMGSLFAPPRPSMIMPSGPMLPFVPDAGDMVLNNAIDTAGNNWNGSRIIFDQQTPTPSGYYVQGHANLQVDGEYVGKEYFSGNYDAATRQLDVTGNAIDQPNLSGNHHLVRTHYTGTIGTDGQTLINGHMEGAPGVSAIPSEFGATQVSP